MYRRLATFNVNNRGGFQKLEVSWGPHLFITPQCILDEQKPVHNSQWELTNLSMEKLDQISWIRGYSFRVWIVITAVVSLPRALVRLLWFFSGGFPHTVLTSNLYQVYRFPQRPIYSPFSSSRASGVAKHNNQEPKEASGPQPRILSPQAKWNMHETTQARSIKHHLPCTHCSSTRMQVWSERLLVGIPAKLN